MSDILRRLSREGVSVWLDDISRERLAGGGLARLIRERHVVGVTSNPTVFAQALASDAEAYAEQLQDLAVRGATAEEAVRELTTYDIRWACDLLRPVHRETGGRDGQVSVEVDPRFARNPDATVAEARALWWAIDRPNLLIKIPATVEGLPAITRCLAEGIGVNATLIFSPERYEQVAEAFLAGVEQAHRAGRDLSRIASVASFFISRVDTAVDQRLDAFGTPETRALRGQAAIAGARLAHRHHGQVFGTGRWDRLAAHGARPQRLLWASTGVKDPGYSDTRYVDELIAPDTVNTMPEATLDAVADHGRVPCRHRMERYYADAQRVRDYLNWFEISYPELLETLEQDGLERFDASWAELLDEIAVQLDKRR
ncbi:transaldolase [Kitasatospora sp. NPDC056138]|uniref:transaldolase n=1 Tax=Kitasatospora sp. NPDC056138 TaxID=3345724 RepID=UPI0035DC7FA2